MFPAHRMWGAAMTFVLSRRLEIKPRELEAAIEDVVEIARQVTESTGLPVTVLEPLGCDVVGALWVVQFAADLAALAVAEGAFASLSDIRVQLNQLWQQRLTQPITQQVHEIVHGEPGVDGPPEDRPIYTVIRSQAAMASEAEAIALAIEHARLLEQMAGDPAVVTVGYSGPWLEVVTTVGHVDLASCERFRRRSEAEPATSALRRRARVLGVTSDTLVLRRVH
jgi:hypothetical protein